MKERKSKIDRSGDQESVYERNSVMKGVLEHGKDRVHRGIE